jgi:hypothetical protein
MTEALQNPPSVYLRGLVQLANNRPKEALQEFERTPIQRIPASYLYPPTRTFSAVYPLRPNPYLVPLRTAVDAGKVSPLIQARVMTQDGRLLEGLNRYLTTDPRQWSRYDVECIRAIARHSGLQSEVQRMLQAAFLARRVPANLASDLRQVAMQRIEPEAESNLKRRLVDRSALNSGIRQLAEASAIRMLGSRKQFLEQDYGAILEQHKDVEPVNQTSELVLMLFLAASAEPDRSAAYRWGQELKRRYPGVEVSRWVDGLAEASGNKG